MSYLLSVQRAGVLFTFCLAIVLLMGIFSPVQATPELEKRITELEAKVKWLAPQSASSQFSDNLSIHGLVQMDFNSYNGVYNYSNEGKTGSDIFVRRVHLRLNHQANEDLDYVMLLLTDDDTTKFLVGFARFRFSDNTELRLGRIKEDLSLSVQYIGEELHAERPMMINAFATGFHWGRRDIGYLIMASEFPLVYLKIKNTPEIKMGGTEMMD